MPGPRSAVEISPESAPPRLSTSRADHSTFGDDDVADVQLLRRREFLFVLVVIRAVIRSFDQLRSDDVANVVVEIAASRAEETSFWTSARLSKRTSSLPAR